MNAFFVRRIIYFKALGLDFYCMKSFHFIQLFKVMGQLSSTCLANIKITRNFENLKPWHILHFLCYKIPLEERDSFKIYYCILNPQRVCHSDFWKGFSVHYKRTTAV